jgi:26S proteasome regulatory subunit N6
MLNQAEDVAMITSSKIALKYSGKEEVQAMKSVTNAYMNRSLHDFERALKDYQHELQEDVVVRTHLSELYDTLLEQHLSRLIEPYSVVEINHIANLIHLETDILEHKLSQMILDKKLVGVLDQGNGLLIIYEEHAVDPLYQSSLEIVQNLNTVIESLYHRTARLK